MKINMKLLVAVILAHILLVSALFVKETFAQEYKPKRSKVIDFDGETVEGINKKSFDSASQVSEEDRSKRRAHLYRVRKGFKDENIQFVREMRSK